MIRFAAVALVVLFLAGLPRFFSSPWFDDQYSTSTQSQSGRLVRVELRDRTRLTLKELSKPALLSVTSEGAGERVSLTCPMRSVTLPREGLGYIETVPGVYCPYSRIPVRVDGFGQIAIGLRGETVVAQRDYRRNPFHLAVEWAKWRTQSSTTVSYYNL